MKSITTYKKIPKIFNTTQDTVNDHSDTISTHTTDILTNHNLLGTHGVQLTKLEGDIDSKTGALTVDMNQMKTDLSTDIGDLTTNVENNYQHAEAKDAALQAGIDGLNTNLADEISAGSARDAKLTEHDDQFNQVNGDISNNQNLISQTQDELNDKFLFLTNYTDAAITAQGLHTDTVIAGIQTDMSTSEQAAQASRDAIQVMVDQTNLDLAAEKTRGDVQVNNFFLLLLLLL